MAVRELCGDRLQDLARDSETLAGSDILFDSDFEALLAARPSWLHGAPVCKTFSRARKKDKYANAKHLRSDERPEGFGDEEANRANKMADRMAALAEL